MTAPGVREGSGIRTPALLAFLRGADGGLGMAKTGVREESVIQTPTRPTLHVVRVVRVAPTHDGPGVRGGSGIRTPTRLTLRRGLK